GRDQIEKVTSQLANLRFLDKSLRGQAHDRDSALVCDLEALPRVKRGRACSLARSGAGLFLEARQIIDDLSPRAARLLNGQLPKVEVAGNPIFHAAVIVLRCGRLPCEQAHSLSLERRLQDARIAGRGDGASPRAFNRFNELDCK